MSRAKRVSYEYLTDCSPSLVPAGMRGSETRTSAISPTPTPMRALMLRRRRRRGGGRGGRGVAGGGRGGGGGRGRDGGGGGSGGCKSVMRSRGGGAYFG